MMDFANVCRVSTHYEADGSMVDSPPPLSHEANLERRRQLAKERGRDYNNIHPSLPALKYLSKEDLDRIYNEGTWSDNLNGVLAILDFSGMKGIDEYTEQEKTPLGPDDYLKHTTEEDAVLKQTVDIPLYRVYSPSGEKSDQEPSTGPGVPKAVIPVYDLARLLHTHHHPRALSLLSQAPYTGPKPQTANTAVALINNTDVGKKDQAHGMQMAKHLWRLRLWNGQGWSAQVNPDWKKRKQQQQQPQLQQAQDERPSDVEMGRRVQGYDEFMEGRMHSRFTDYHKWEWLKKLAEAKKIGRSRSLRGRRRTKGRRRGRR